MNIFDFAISMEKEGEEYYRDLAKKTPDKGLNRILTMLADDEAKHAQALEKMRQRQQPAMPATGILTNAKNIFRQYKEDNVQLIADKNQIELYQKALEIEQRSEDFYRQNAKEISDQKEKELLLLIAEEEKKHIHLVRNIIDLVSRPLTWVENAEFNKLDEDY